MTIPFLPALGELITLAPLYLRRRLILLLVVSFFGGVAELLTVGAVVPLLIAATYPRRLEHLPILGDAFLRTIETIPTGPVVACAILLSAFGIVAAAIRLLVLWLSQNFVYGLHRATVTAMYSGILSRPYEWFVTNNGAEFVASIDKVFAIAGNLMVAIIAAVPAVLMSLAILVLLFYLSPLIAALVTVVLGLLYFALAHFALRSADQLSRSAAGLRDRRTRFAQETWGAVRDIIIDRTQIAYLNEVSKLEERFADLHVRASLIGLAPRIIVEAAILLLISAVVAILARTPADLLLVLPVLGAFAIGGQRLMPLLQQIYLAYANQKIFLAYVDDALAYTEQGHRSKRMGSTPQRIDFKSTIELRDVSFSYAGGRTALRDVNLLVRRGERMGIAGKTGSGKSTLADILMGLIAPSTGEVMVDGVALTPTVLADWHAKIAHVPQTIFLADDTLIANVTFAERDRPIDQSRAMRACVDAGLTEFLAESPHGLMRKIGERGVQLSGGQRQRIGIARALYKNADLLVLDEATSALDLETEQMVLDTIFTSRPHLTIILISHRPASLDLCDRIISLRSGAVVDA